MKITDLCRGVSGTIELFMRDRDGRDTVLGVRHNVVLNSSKDLSALAVAGLKYINGMYFAFTNDAGLLPQSTPDLGCTALTYQTAKSSGQLGFVRAPLIAVPTLDSSDVTLYNSNRVSFVSLSGGAVAVPSGSNAVLDGTSLFYGAALAYLDPLQLSSDVLFSAAVFADISPTLPSGALLKIAGASIGLRWTLTFAN